MIAAKGLGVLAVAGLALAGPAVAQEAIPYGPEARMQGLFETAFEHSSFNGCWLEMTPEAAEQYRTFLAGNDPVTDKYGRSRVELEIVGRKADKREGLFGGYGHLGASPCQIQAVRVLAARPAAGSLVPEDRDVSTGG
jgi:hypothetical protein